MTRTVDVSGWPVVLFQYLCLGAMVVGFVGTGAVAVLGALVRVLVAVGLVVAVPFRAVAAVALVGGWVVWTAAFVRRGRADDGSSGDDLWSGVPGDQYLGRFAESGGLARHDQERALDRLSDDGDS